MKRSKYVHLTLAAAVSVAIVGCESTEPTKSVMKRTTFQSVEECTSAHVPVQVCADAYVRALSEHRRLAPTYANQKDCEADFIEGYCVADSKQQYSPILGGFDLVTTGQLTQSQIDAAMATVPATSASSSSGSSGGSNDGFLTGLLVGNMLSSNGGGYHSEPVYRYRDSRGSYQSSTIRKRIEERQPSSSGAVFSKARSSDNQPYTSSVASRPTQKPVSANSVSRGGFGSSAAAKSGWGGSSRSFGG